MKLIVFGAGEMGRYAGQLLKHDGHEVLCFIDNDPGKWNTTIDGIPIINFEQYKKITEPHTLILALNEHNRKQVVKQLECCENKSYKTFDEKQFWGRERLFSYSYLKDMEDVILYDVLYNEKEIFYIDIGSNDPVEGSVTKLLYDVKNAHGINVEPQKRLIELTNRERPRDINLQFGVGDKKERKKLFLQDAQSTLVSDNVTREGCLTEIIDIITLEQICNDYLPANQKISFLKIDVEGYEKEVLLGGDFKKYRPEIILIESTKPDTLNYNFENWESILFQNHYHFVYEHGVNRYYVADEKRELDGRFLDIEVLKHIYQIYHVSFEVIK